MDELSYIFHSLNQPSRMKIMLLLERYENICVGELAEALEVTSAAVSQHLRILEVAGLVRRERRGQKNYYQVQTDDPLIRDVLRLLHRQTAVYETYP